MDYLKLITFIALYAYQVYCWTLEFGYASERLLKFQPTYKMRRTNFMVTNLSNNQSTHQKWFVRDNAVYFASVKNDNSKNDKNILYEWTSEILWNIYFH